MAERNTRKRKKRKMRHEELEERDQLINTIRAFANSRGVPIEQGWTNIHDLPGNQFVEDMVKLQALWRGYSARTRSA